MTLWELLGRLHPRVAELLEADLDEGSPLWGGMLANAAAGAVLWRLAPFEPTEEREAAMAGEARSLLRLADQASDDLARLWLADLRAEWQGRGLGGLCPRCGACVRDEDGLVLEGYADEPHVCGVAA